MVIKNAEGSLQTLRQRVWACRRAPLKGVFRHRHQRKSSSRWRSDASSVASSTLLASDGPTGHVLRFRSTWSVGLHGHLRTLCSVEDRELILSDESSRSYLRAAGTSGRPERDFADRQSADELAIFPGAPCAPVARWVCRPRAPKTEHVVCRAMRCRQRRTSDADGISWPSSIGFLLRAVSKDTFVRRTPTCPNPLSQSLKDSFGVFNDHVCRLRDIWPNA